MSETNVKLQRILLPLDVSRDSLAALQTALDLAAALNGEVSGLFVEDMRLVSAAGLPFAREIGSRSGISRNIGSEDIEHRFRAVAGKARAALSESAGRQNVRSSFRTRRGDIATEILTASSEADLIVLGKAGWSGGTFHKAGDTCVSILTQSRVPVLVVESGSQLSPPIVVADDRTPGAQRAVETAKEISRSLKWKLVVLLLEPVKTGALVFQSVQSNRPRFFVLPASLRQNDLLSQLRCPVLFVP